jgi:dynactin 1
LNKQLQQSQQESKSVREQYEAYKEEMSNYESRIEELTVDKELAEARLEELQEEMEKIQEKNEEIKLELEVLKGEIELEGVEGAANTFKSKQAEKEQEQLKAAIIKLRDLSIQDKSELGSLRKKHDELGIKHKNLQKECESLKNQNSEFMAQINELKNQVTATLGSVEIIEQLTEQNLDLEAKVAELKEAIEDLEAINEVNDQIQENAREEEKELREVLDLCESKIREYERQIEALKYSISDHDKTIIKFRELVKQLQFDNESLTRQLKEQHQNSLNTSSSSIAQNSSSTYDFKQKFLDTQNLSKHIENEINKIELNSSRKYASYLISFMPETFVKQSGSNEGLLTLVFFKRLANKSDLMFNHFKDKISNLLSSSNGGDSATTSTSSNQFAFYYEICCYMSNIRLLCNKFDYILNNCDLKLFTTISSMYFDFNRNEKQLDSLIELMQKDQLDESINLDSLEKMCSHFQIILVNYLSQEKFDQFAMLNDLALYGFMSCESIAIDSQRVLQSLIDQKEDSSGSSEIVMLFREILFRIDEIRSLLKKLQRNLPKEEKLLSKIELNFPQRMITEIETLFNNFHLISTSLKEIYSSLNDTLISNESLSAKRLESLAYQACDKVFSKQDNGPYNNFKNALQQINSCLTQTAASLENGEFEKELSDEEFNIKKYLINSPMQKAADEFKMALADAENIRQRLEKKDDELKELKKTLKTKSDELSEQKLRINIVEKKFETQLKEYEEKNVKLTKAIEEIESAHAKKDKQSSDIIETLQQEVDSLSNERRDLKEKMRKNKLLESIMPRQASESNLTDLAKNQSQQRSANTSSESFSALVFEVGFFFLICKTKIK